MATEASPVIEIAGLVKHYRGLRPLRVKTLVVRDGERVAVSGLDAVAAEVFVNLLNGAILPDEGDVTVLGQRTADITSEQAWLASLERIGIVTPRAVLLEGSTVAQNLALPFTLDIDPIPDDVWPRIRDLAGAAGLAADALAALAGHAAPAVRMRLHLARALALGPRLVLLEHPTLGLPADQVGAFADSVAAAADAKALTVLAVTEDEVFADRLAGRALRVQAATGALVNARGWRRWI